MKYIFGPVPSRRLCRSLGVDLIPYKHCSFDCIYCQLGATVHKRAERQQFVDTGEVIAELESALPCVEADYVTLSGSGEPTLCLGIGELIEGIKELTEIPVAVLTNSSLMSCAEVRKELLGADLVIPSVDAATQDVFERINRPCSGLRIEDILCGLEEFSYEYSGKLWIEVMMVRDINDSDDEIDKIASALTRIRCEKIQLNTVERPPAESFARALTQGALEKARRRFDDRAELIVASGIYQDADGSFHSPAGAGLGAPGIEADCGRVLELLKRRPCTVRDIAEGLDLNINEAAKFVGILKGEGLICAIRREGRAYFFANDGN